MNYVIIGGIAWDVIVTGITRNFEIVQSENSVKVIHNNRTILDPKGTEISYTVTFKRRKGHERTFDRLWDFVSRPRYDGVPVKIVYNQELLEFDARFTTGKQNLRKIDEKNELVIWDSFSLNIIPMEVQITP